MLRPPTLNRPSRTERDDPRALQKSTTDTPWSRPCSWGRWPRCCRRIVGPGARRIDVPLPLRLRECGQFPFRRHPGIRQVPSALPTPARPPRPPRNAACRGARPARAASPPCRRMRLPFVHASLTRTTAPPATPPSPAGTGKCQSQSAAAWTLKKPEPEILLRLPRPQGPVEERPHRRPAGELPLLPRPALLHHKGLLNESPETVCMNCHEVEPLLTKPVRHAPVAEGRCLDCHNPHGSDAPNLIRSAGNTFCLKCHDSKAPQGLNEAGPGYRIDMGEAGHPRRAQPRRLRPVPREGPLRREPQAAEEVGGRHLLRLPPAQGQGQVPAQRGGRRRLRRLPRAAQRRTSRSCSPRRPSTRPASSATRTT